MFKNKVVPNLKTSPKVVITVNGEQYHPITNKKVKPIIIDDKVYIPVHKPAKALEVKNPITPTKEGKINTFNMGGHTYIPLSVVPKVFKPIFINKPVKVTQEALKTTTIQINGGHFLPVSDKQHKVVILDGVKYIPVKQVPESHQAKHPIVTSFEGKINTFKIDGKTYIPLSVVPKVYAPLFTHKIAPAVTPVPKIVISVGDGHFVPITSKVVVPIVKNNITYIPVNKVNDTHQIKNPIVPKN